MTHSHRWMICPNCYQSHIAKVGETNLAEENETLKEKFRKIKNWTKAYPLVVYPEPDMELAAKVLKENGLSLDAISASNMRHVLKGVASIIDED